MSSRRQRRDRMFDWVVSQSRGNRRIPFNDSQEREGL